MSPVGVVPPATTGVELDGARGQERPVDCLLAGTAAQDTANGSDDQGRRAEFGGGLPDIADPGQVGVGVGDDADLAAGDRTGLGHDLGEGGGHTCVGGRAAAGSGQAEAGGDPGAQVGVDVGQDLELALLDGLLVALAELEGEGLDDVGLLKRGQAAVEHRRLA
jgi:hypothetical protein